MTMRIRSYCVVFVMATASCVPRLGSGPSCEFKTHLSEDSSHRHASNGEHGVLGFVVEGGGGGR